MKTLLAIAALSLVGCRTLGADELTACLDVCAAHGGPTCIKAYFLTDAVKCECSDGSEHDAPRYDGSPQ